MTIVLWEATTESAPFTARRRSLALAALALVLALPYWLAGPGWFREDFASLVNATFDGSFGAAGDIVGPNRPVAALVYAFVFGVLGDHPAVAFGMVVALLATTAGLLHALLDRFFGALVSFCGAALYLLSPSQSSISHWASTSNVQVALVLLLTALLVAHDEERWLVSGLLVAAGILSYEAIFPAAVFGWVALAIVRRSDWRGPAKALLVAIPAAAWVSLSSTNADPHLLRFGDGISSLFGWGLTDLDPLWRLVLLLITIGAATMAARWIVGRVPDDGEPERLLGLGAAIVLVGYLPFLLFGFGMGFSGEGDRANFIAAVGASLTLTAIGWRLARSAPGTRGALVAAVYAVGVVALVLPTRLQNDREWASVWDDTRSAIADAAAEPRRGTESTPVPECPVVRNGVQGIDTSYSATMALRWWTADPDIVAVCGDE